MGLLALAIAGIASAAISATVSGIQNYQNINAQKEANEQNVKMQQETNAQNQYNIEHAHQIEMKDLEAAGLNPVLTATGGSGAPISQLQSPSVKPVQTDLSGINSAISSAMNSMTMMMMAKSMANTNQALLSQREAGKNVRLGQVLAARSANTHYQHTASTHASSKAVKKAIKAIAEDDDLSWDFLDDPKKMPWE